jgi:hypothetical protein
MGYYIDLVNADLFIPAANLEEALRRLKALNHKPGVEKQGGSWGTLADGTWGTKAKWFSWMDADYDQHVSSAGEVFEMLGFETYEDELGLRLEGYSSKIGQEELFLDEVADLFEPGAFAEWRGEDGAMWKWTPQGTKTGRVVYDD